MSKTGDVIYVKIGSSLVGRLALNSNNLAVFEYDSDWVKTGFSISPIYLPLKSEVFVAKKDPFNGLFGVFNDSLPDGWGNLLLDRLLMEKGVDYRKLTILDRLSIVGKNGLGALSYEPASLEYATSKDFDLDYFAEEAVKILNAQSTDALESMFNYNSSSVEARPKVIRNYEDCDWMVKFPSVYDSKNIGKIEYQCSLKAIKAGIKISETRLFEGKYFGVKLFDRDNTQRFHVHTASGLLYADHRLPALDYNDLMKLSFYLTQDVREVEKMFRLMIFNIAIGNKDDHAKNFSFIVKNKKWLLTPAYDITPNSGFNNNHSTTILGKGNPEKKNIVELGKRHGFSLQRINTIIDQVYSAI